MSTLEAALLFLCVEFAALAVALAFLQLRGGRRQQRTTLDNVTSLVSTVEQVAAPRREALLTVLRETYRFDEEKAEQVVTDFIEREHAFYNALIGVHLGRGGKTLADVPAEVTRLVAPWLRLTPSKLVDESAVEALQTQNLALTNQLAETKQVLEDLMSEYSAAFLRGKSEPMVRVDAEDPPPAPEVTLADEDPVPAGPAPLGEVPDDELLSMDEVGDLASAEASMSADAGAADADPGFAQNVIDLDGDDDPALVDAPPPLSQSDLDALMDNLGLDEPGAKAVTA
ncbi:MAG TPA: hypothetical protein PJ986_05660 [Gammaproteobacteria bacterium]|mgnify:CR=1 FL=1|nr:hypothetical protein [Gammaproteobacteria bacterium]